MRIPIRFLLPFCVFLILASGCASTRRSSLPVTPIVSAADVLAGAAERFPEDAVLMSRARIRVESDRGTLSAGMVLFAGRPALLRIEALSLLGLPEMILAADGRSLKIHDLREGKFYVGSADQDFSCFLPIHLTAGEAVAFSLGLYPLLEGSETLQGGTTQEPCRIDYHRNGRITKSLWLEAGTLDMKRLERYESGVPVYAVDFDRYREIDGHRLPGVITVHFERPEKMVMTLRFSSSEILQGQAVDFHLEPPEGVTPRALDKDSEE